MTAQAFIQADSMGPGWTPYEAAINIPCGVCRLVSAVSGRLCGSSFSFLGMQWEWL